MYSRKFFGKFSVPSKSSDRLLGFERGLALNNTSHVTRYFNQNRCCLSIFDRPPGRTTIFGKFFRSYIDDLGPPNSKSGDGKVKSRLGSLTKNVLSAGEPSKKKAPKSSKLKKAYGKSSKIDNSLYSNEFESILYEEDLPENLKPPSSSASSNDVPFTPRPVTKFNYKTFRYKDLDLKDPEVVNVTFPASTGPQVSKSQKHIIHNKGEPVEDLSKDDYLKLAGVEIPFGLDSAPTSYADKVLKTIYDVIVGEKGQDIVAINIDSKTNWVPNMIIVTALAPRHCLTIAQMIDMELKRLKLCKTAKISRNEGDEWVIVSTPTAIVEIMTQETREHMDLERLWVLKRSKQETFEFDEDEDLFMYDEEDGLWDEE